MFLNKILVNDETNTVSLDGTKDLKVRGGHSSQDMGTVFDIRYNMGNVKSVFSSEERNISEQSKNNFVSKNYIMCFGQFRSRSKAKGLLEKLHFKQFIKKRQGGECFDIWYLRFKMLEYYYYIKIKIN